MPLATQQIRSFDMNTMNITSAQYVNDSLSGANTSISATIDGQEWSVPLTPGNRHYDEIMRQVEAGDLVIQEANEIPSNE
jgi:hypothetical protein